MSERIERDGAWTARDVHMYEFGHGTLAVSWALELDDGTPCALLLIEPGLGSGTVGAAVPSRQPGARVYPTDGATVLCFDSAASVEVVIEALEQIRASLAARAA